MLFSSLVFLFVFLPVTLLIYYFLPAKIRNITLLISSLLFYAWAGVSYSALMIISIICNFFIGKKLNCINKKLFLKIGIAFNVLMLVVFKYTNFIVYNLNTAFEFVQLNPIPQTNVVLPIGISFYTFQAMSYLIDAYYGRTEIQKKIGHLGLYISLFPQLIAGPIVRYHEIKEQLLYREHNKEIFAKGIQRFILGLAKKVILANSFALIVDQVFSTNVYSIDIVTAWLGIILYALQIFFDFSGYSDMAIGLGFMFGFKIPENFNYPYIARSIKDFWRRWHITLSSWFRDYLYIPLGGNRRGRNRTLLNLILVFAVTGLWHGASWNFLIWGLFHGFFLLIERIGFNKKLDKINPLIQHMYTLIIVLVAWVFFRSDNIAHAIQYCKTMFGLSEYSFVANDKLYISGYLTSKNIALIILGVLCSTPLFRKLWYAVTSFGYKQDKLISNFINNVLEILKLALVFIAFAYCIMELTVGTYNPFIYFRF